MFLRDKDLGRNQNNRNRVLEQAKAQREARNILKNHEYHGRKVNAFIRGRLCCKQVQKENRNLLTLKLVDIQRLKDLLGNPTLALPSEALFSLLRILLSFYNNSSKDRKLLYELCMCFFYAITANDGSIISESIITTQQIWQLKRLIDLCLTYPSDDFQWQISKHESEKIANQQTISDPCLQLLQLLVSYNGELKSYIWSTSLCVVKTSKQMYLGMERACISSILRDILLRSEKRKNSTSCYYITQFAREAMDLLLVLMNSAPKMNDHFLTHILSVPSLIEVASVPVMLRILETTWFSKYIHYAVSIPLKNLPKASETAICSEIWLLGNLLWLVDRDIQKSSAIIRDELMLLTKVLQLVPSDTYSSIGVSWTQITSSHSVPTVFPDELNMQLQILVHDQFIRRVLRKIIWYQPENLKNPMLTTRPAPMNPMASTVAEQYGFGEISSSNSVAASVSNTWEKFKALTTQPQYRSRQSEKKNSSWAKRLLEKAGLRSKRSSSITSEESKPASVAEKFVEIKRSDSIRQEAYDIAFVNSFCNLYSTFLRRWHDTPHTLSMLNSIAFYQFPLSGASSGQYSFIAFLWAVFQDRPSFRSFSSVDLLRVDENDEFVCIFVLFCATYHHLLVILDDEEMYEQEFPLALHQVERFIKLLKRILHAAFWVHGNLLPSGSNENDIKSLAFGMYAVEVATIVMRDLYRRCSRHPFCNVTTWILPELDSNAILTEALAGTPRANKLLTSVPFVLPFPLRVKLFQKLIQADKNTYQNENSRPIRVMIRRNLLLEDGLIKLSKVSDLKRKIQVGFVNSAGAEEIGIDAGGLFKEFWLDLANLAFDLEYGLFLVTSNDNLLYPNPHSASPHFTRVENHLTLFQFLGRILGKALYEGIVVEPKFAPFFLTKILQNHNYINDLPSLDPEIYKNLMFLKTYDGDFSDLGLTFTAVQSEFGAQVEVPLIPNGDNIQVTNANKTRYIHLVANYYLNTQIKDQSAAFRAGLYDLIDIRWIKMFNEPELQVLISGKSGTFDIDDLRAHTQYAGGYFAMDRRVLWFWQALRSFTPLEQAKFLRFATSCQRAPSLGFQALEPPFTIQRVSIRANDDLLPSSSTCFNILKLPTYSSYETLRTKLLISISSGAGFEIT